MKRSLLFFVLVAFCSQAFAQSDALKRVQASQDKYFDSILDAQKAYRQDLAKAIKLADRAEVYLLDFMTKYAYESKLNKSITKPKYIKVNSQGGTHFPVNPYKTITGILDRKELSKDETTELVKHISNLVGTKSNPSGAFCHYPIHGVRLYAGSDLIFESSFCWICSNFFIDYLNYDSGWFGIAKLHRNKAEKFLNQIMPIPEAELARFKKFNSPKQKEK